MTRRLLLLLLLLLLCRLRFRLLPLLLLLEEAEPEDVVERAAGGRLEELAVAAEHAQHLVQGSTPSSSPPISARLPRLVRQALLVPAPPRPLLPRRPLVVANAAAPHVAYGQHGGPHQRRHRIGPRFQKLLGGGGGERERGRGGDRKSVV